MILYYTIIYSAAAILYYYIIRLNYNVNAMIINVTCNKYCYLALHKIILYINMKEYNNNDVYNMLYVRVK